MPGLTTKTRTSTSRNNARGTNPQAGPDINEETGTSDRKTILYLDVIGTLVLQEGSRFRLAPFAREFVFTVRDQFELVFMTGVSESTAKRVSSLLDTEIAYGYYKRALGKVTGIDFDRRFIWIDDAPNSRDLMTLCDERCSGQLIIVNGKDGVTRATLNKIDALCEEMQQTA